jgi:acyl-homoserine lactone acylase PvdQ
MSLMHRKLGYLGIAMLYATMLAMPSVPAAAASGCVTISPPAGPVFLDCSGGQVLNVLAPGENGLVTLPELRAGQQPPHSQDQRSMYSDLLQVAPHLQQSQLGTYFKAARLGAASGDVARVEQPTPGLVIVRDRSFGIPHVYGATRDATEFGAGFAAAEDRLFQMDVLRHVGRARLAELTGATPAAIAMDCSVAAAAGYSEPELQQQFDQLAAEFPARFSAKRTEGQQVQMDIEAYVAGVNAFIAAAVSDPSLLPVEYLSLRQVPALWKVTDVVAVATIVQAIFASGGGNEVSSALFHDSLVARYGAGRGTSIWHDFRSQNDPEAPTTIGTPFPYLTGGSVNPAAVAVPLQPSTSSACNSGPPPAPGAGLGRVTAGASSIDVGFTLLPRRDMSNALLVAGSKTEDGHPIAVFGPQVGYSAPAFLHEEDIHGPGISARGAAFPGSSGYVELGRGADYAWSATSAGSDITDQRLEKLCNPDGSAPTMSSTSYVFNGRCVAMYERTDREVAGPTPAAPQGAVVTIQIERTVHGPVVGRTTADDPTTGTAVPVAVSLQRSTWFDELSSAAAFLEWNDPDRIRGAHDFLRTAARSTGTFNWFYADARDIAYYSAGRLPIRARGVDPNFPSWGTGEWEWRGFLPATGLPNDPHPHAINPRSGFLTNWNNKPAPEWSAADNNYAYGPVFRVQSLSDRLRRAVAGGETSRADVVNAMEDAATVDLDGSQLVAPVLALLRPVSLTPEQRQVAALLQGWAAAGAHRRALADAQAYDMGSAVAVMDALYPRLAHAVFDPWLSPAQFGQLTSIMGLNDPPGPGGSAYDGGWEGYLQRSMRQALDPSIPNAYSQSYCGSGSLTACQAAVLGALQGAIDALTQAYGSSDPAAWTCARSNGGSGQCNPARDDIQFQPTGALQVPGIPWVNRPTFQQVVQYPARR